MHRSRECTNPKNQEIGDYLNSIIERKFWVHFDNPGLMNKTSESKPSQYATMSSIIVLLKDNDDGTHRCKSSLNMDENSKCSHNLYNNKVKYVKYLIASISTSLNMSEFAKRVKLMQKGLCKNCAFILSPYISMLCDYVYSNQTLTDYNQKIQLIGMYLIECMQYHLLAKYLLSISNNLNYILQTACELLKMIHIYEKSRCNTDIVYDISDLLWVQIVRNFLEFMKRYLREKNIKKTHWMTKWEMMLKNRTCELYIEMEPYFELVLKWIYNDLKKFWMSQNQKRNGLYCVLNVFVQFGIVIKCDFNDIICEKWMKELLNLKLKWKKLDCYERKTKEKYEIFNSLKESLLLMPPHNGKIANSVFKKSYISMINHIGFWYETGKASRGNCLMILELMILRADCNWTKSECLWLKCKNKHSNTKLFRCSKCKVALYCRRKCQKKDWSKGMHRLICRTFCE
eukprot:548630_1